MSELPGYARFCQQHAVKPFLNVGVGANIVGWEGPGIFHLDYDRWRYHNCVQADAHHLPFRDDAFASVVAGDVLEHFVDPLQCLHEIRRVAPMTVLTTFQEWRLDGPGRDIAKGQQLFAPCEASFEPYRLSGRFLAHKAENGLSHIPHIWQWSAEILTRLFARARLKIEKYESDCPGVHDGHPMLNHCFILRRT